jgi:TetR/AcrR family transcriptional regulator
MSTPQASKYANFERIAAEEQARILDACIEEFAQHGYAVASTNAIVKRAGIPKGTLFYYFGSKKDLYLYVLDGAVTRFVEAFDRLAGELPADLFERLLHRGRTRMRFVVEHPRLYRLFFNAFMHTPDDLQTEMAPRYAAYAAASRERLLEGLDFTLFRDDIDIDQAIELVNLVLEGIANRYMPALQRHSPQEALEMVERLTVETRQYFEMLKKGMYK